MKGFYIQSEARGVYFVRLGGSIPNNVSQNNLFHTVFRILSKIISFLNKILLQPSHYFFNVFQS